MLSVSVFVHCVYAVLREQLQSPKMRVRMCGKKSAFPRACLLLFFLCCFIAFSCFLFLFLVLSCLSLLTSLTVRGEERTSERVCNREETNTHTQKEDPDL